MKSPRLSGLLVTAGLTCLLSGCVIAPVGHRPYGMYPAYPVVVEPAVVVVPAAPYYRHRGHRRWR